MSSESTDTHQPLRGVVYPETKRVRLVPLRDVHLPILHHWRNSATFLRNCTNRRSGIDYSGFVAELNGDFRRDRHEQFVVQRKSDGEFIGTVYSYNFNRVDAYAFITIFLQDDKQHLGYGVDGVALLLQHLFTTRGLFKVYMEVYEYNSAVINVIKKTGVMTEEGRFRKQRLWNGERYDVVRFAIFIDSLVAINNFLSKLGQDHERG